MDHANVVQGFLNVCESIEISVLLRGQVTYMVVVLSEPCFLAMSFSNPFQSMASFSPYRGWSSWWRQMEAFSALLAITNAGEVGFDVYFDLLLNKRLSKQSWSWWFEVPSCPLCCHCNVLGNFWRTGYQYQCDLAICLKYESVQIALDLGMLYLTISNENG